MRSGAMAVNCGSPDDSLLSTMIEPQLQSIPLENSQNQLQTSLSIGCRLFAWRVGQSTQLLSLRLPLTLGPHIFYLHVASVCPPILPPYRFTTRYVSILIAAELAGRAHAHTSVLGADGEYADAMNSPIPLHCPCSASATITTPHLSCAHYGMLWSLSVSYLSVSTPDLVPPMGGP